MVIMKMIRMVIIETILTIKTTISTIILIVTQIKTRTLHKHILKGNNMNNSSDNSNCHNSHNDYCCVNRNTPQANTMDGERQRNYISNYRMGLHIRLPCG